MIDPDKLIEYRQNAQDFVEQGLVWLVNTTILHPRGFALAYYVGEEGNVGPHLLVKRFGEYTAFNMSVKELEGTITGYLVAELQREQERNRLIAAANALLPIRPDGVWCGVAPPTHEQRELAWAAGIEFTYDDEGEALPPWEGDEHCVDPGCPCRTTDPEADAETVECFEHEYVHERNPEYHHCIHCEAWEPHDWKKSGIECAVCKLSHPRFWLCGGTDPKYPGEACPLPLNHDGGCFGDVEG